ncbi:transaldolase [Pleionea sediminis]|uniref:transaldolase n=1 Tax=Pleionea sediminis TaxID=2569479 RepID=UPI0011869BA4|nr:transaldolase [Pleionea sediminis]
MSQLEQLKSMTTVVADTGDFSAISAFKPEDTTTNPSLILKAVSNERFRPLLQEAIEMANQESNESLSLVESACDYLSVLIGKKLIEQIPGRNSTEVNARLSFDRDATITKAKRIIELYENLGVSRDRVLIKIASTWEGIQAARQLEKDNIQCNLTLLFNFAQARACAEAGVFLISPFVGRILDWYKAKTGRDNLSIKDDPGVASVTRIYNYYKELNYSTIVMGASFRSKEQVLALAGCDKLTIAPTLLDELAKSRESFEIRLVAKLGDEIRPEPMTEQEFRWQMVEDAMATEKLAEGIRAFAADQKQLESLMAEELAKH